MHHSALQDRKRSSSSGITHRCPHGHLSWSDSLGGRRESSFPKEPQLQVKVTTQHEKLRAPSPPLPGFWCLQSCSNPATLPKQPAGEPQPFEQSPEANSQPHFQQALPPAAAQSTGKASATVPGTPAHPAQPGPSQRAQGSCR